MYYVDNSIKYIDILILIIGLLKNICNKNIFWEERGGERGGGENSHSLTHFLF